MFFLFRDISQLKTSFTYKQSFIFFDINQSESIITYNEIVSFLISTIRIEFSFTGNFCSLNKLNEVSTDFKTFLDQNNKAIYKFSESITSIEKISNITNVYNLLQIEIELKSKKDLEKVALKFMIVIVFNNQKNLPHKPV